MKKKLSLFLIISILSILFIVPNTMVNATSNPYIHYNYYNSSTDYQIACTWYAWQYLYDNYNITIPSNWGNGGTWYPRAQSAGYSTGSIPSVGAIAC